MRPTLKRSALLVAAALGLAAAWLGLRDPYGALPLAESAPVLVQDRSLPVKGRTLRTVTLREPALGEVNFVLSLPDPLPPRPLPVVVVLGGLGRGAENLAPLPDPGENVVVGYDWPMPPRLPTGWNLLARAPDLYGRVLTVPGQVDAALAWTAQQPWADAGRMSLLGFSLGALAAPAIQRVLEDRGQRVGWTVLAYGGAPIGDLLSSHPLVRPAWARPVLGAAAHLLLRPVEPLAHLPHVEGRFLFLAGREDRLIPARASETLRTATPQPRTDVFFDGDHMGVGEHQRSLLDAIVRASTAWLVSQEAVNPPLAWQVGTRHQSPLTVDQ